MNAHRSRLFLLVLLLLAFGWRLARLDFQSLWRDEVDAIYFAVRSLDETLRMFWQAAQNGPLYFLALRPWFAVAGSSEFVLRFPSAAIGALSTALVWQVGRRLLPVAPAVKLPAAVAWVGIAEVGALLFAFNPYQIWYGQEGKMYATVTALALLGTWCWLRGMEGGGWRYWLAYLVVVSMAMYVHLLMVLLIPLHLLWFAVAWPQARRHGRGYGVALAGLTLPYLPMVWWHWEMLTSPARLSGFAFTPLDTMLRALALSHARGFMTATPLLWLTPVFFLLGAGMLFGATVIGATVIGATVPGATVPGATVPGATVPGATVPGAAAGNNPAPVQTASLAPRRRFAMLLIWLLAPVLMIYLLSLRQPVFTERYIIWIGPAALLLMSLGLYVVAVNSGRFALPVAAGFLVCVLGVWGVLAWQQKTTIIKYDLRSAMQYVDQVRSRDDLLILQIPHQEWAYRYYTSDFGPSPFTGSDTRLGRWAGGPYTNWGRADDIEWGEVTRYMEAITQGADDVWVLLSEATMWDDRRMMERWLAQHGDLIEERSFTGVTVHHYQLDQ